MAWAAFHGQTGMKAAREWHPLLAWRGGGEEEMVGMTDRQAGFHLRQACAVCGVEKLCGWDGFEQTGSETKKNMASMAWA